MLTQADLAALFGDAPDGDGATRARASRRTFVRTSRAIHAAPTAVVGRRISAWELWTTYDDPVLAELARRGEATTNADGQSVVRQQIERLRVNVAKATGLSPDTTDVFVQERLARVVGVDDRSLSNGALADEAGERLALRLRDHRARGARLNEKAVLTLAEAAWVARTQLRLRSWLVSEAVDLGSLGFAPDRQYGEAGLLPPFEHGFMLARKTRRLLGLAEDEPIENLRALVEVRLGIPVIQAELPPRVAGATLQTGSGRGIVLNVVGPNQNVLVRRATLAHELGHLLWDPDERLEDLVVDAYDAIDAGYERARIDVVEQRANAFAIELLAPQSGLRALAKRGTLSAALRQTMDRFGISRTAARFHLGNALGQDLAQVAGQVNPGPNDDWRGRESFTVDFFPLGEATPVHRRGAFAGWVAAALGHGLLTDETALEYLGQPERSALSRAERETLCDLFPHIPTEPEARTPGRSGPRLDESANRPIAIHANLAWLRAHSAEHAGRLVALREGRLVASVLTANELRANLAGQGLGIADVFVVPIGPANAAA